MAQDSDISFNDVSEMASPIPIDASATTTESLDLPLIRYLTSLLLFQSMLMLEGEVNRNLNHFHIPCYTWDIF